MAPLENMRHEAFALEYVVDFNATAAAQRAGFAAGNSGAVIGCRLLRRRDVAERVAELMAERTERVKVTADQVIERLVRLADSCMQEVPVYQHGELVAFRVQNANAAARALEMLGRHLGMFVDRIEQTGDQEIVLEWQKPIPAGDDEPAFDDQGRLVRPGDEQPN
jgi:phage terminase small subunit